MSRTRGPKADLGQRLEPRRDGAPGNAHGIESCAWREAPNLPATLPDGQLWPALLAIVLPGPSAPRATAESIEAQSYPDLRCVILNRTAEFAACVARSEAAHVVALRAGDRLAPGALAALVCEAVLSGAEVVAGLRVLYDEGGVIGLDALACRDGPLDAAEALRTVRDEEAAPFTGGEILLARATLLRALEGPTVDGTEAEMAREPPPREPMSPLAALWPRLARDGARMARIGRPVLLQRDPGGRERPNGVRPLSIAMLTDLGYRGGAGIAQRRLGEALALCGHGVAPLRLDTESPPAAAEWTDAFPRTRETAAAHDLVLAGNLHGCTRSIDILGDLARAGPVAAVLHDLFALTGRCAHPKACRLIETGCDARCPSPDAYPQLAPSRIAAAHAGKRAILSGPQAPLLLANSDWALDRARAWGPADARIERIRLAFPAGVFRPRPRAAVRRELGLPLSDRLVVFGAVIADAPDKGFADLVRALRRVAGPGIGFVALGRLDDPRALGLANLHAPGLVGDEARLAAYYAACDVHVTASRLETFGQTPIEAGLCGLPTIAYRATGLTCAVIDGVTGLLVDPDASVPGAALGDALAGLLADEARRTRLGAMARIVFENRFSHAASALSLGDALVRHGIGSRFRTRVVFAPAMLGRFAFAARRDPGAAGTVAAPSPPLVRRLRRLKHALIGRGMPLSLRRVLYAAAVLRRALARADSRSRPHP